MPFIGSVGGSRSGRLFSIGAKPGIPQSVSLAINGAGSMAVTYTAPASNGRSTNYFV
jgi:hypothetical protein